MKKIPDGTFVADIPRGTKITIVLKDGTKYKGYMMPVTMARWGNKRKSEPTFGMVVGENILHAPLAAMQNIYYS